jgi:hypothetical protein
MINHELQEAAEYKEYIAVLEQAVKVDLHTQGVPWEVINSQDCHALLGFLTGLRFARSKKGNV